MLGLTTTRQYRALQQQLADTDKQLVEEHAKTHRLHLAWKSAQRRANQYRGEIHTRDRVIRSLDQQLDDALGYTPVQRDHLDRGAAWQTRRIDKTKNFGR